MKRERVELTLEERKAVRRLRFEARLQRKRDGKGKQSVPSNAELLARVRSGNGPKPKRARTFVVQGETPSLKDRF